MAADRILSISCFDMEWFASKLLIERRFSIVSNVSMQKLDLVLFLRLA
jgi:hypothetical protein